jgi:adenylate cyclase
MAQNVFKRKLTAVLIADVVGYSRLMEEEDMTTVRNLREYQKVIASHISQYRGRVVDSPGDNLLSEFKSVVDAVQCAVDIQRELAERNAKFSDNRKMEYRIGVNLGDVIQEGKKIYGDGINVAARLEALAEPGGICISGIVYDQVKKKINLKYHFVGKKRIKNIEEPVDVYQVIFVESSEPDELIKANVEKMAFPLPKKPSIAVLPFTNMSGDPAQEYIGDGISENIINALSMGSAIFVIARNSTFTYKEGSVQKSGDWLRVTAQLIDALNGHHLWSEKYDRKMGELFDLQDEITKKIVVSLQVELTFGEQARVFAKSTDNLDAWCYGVKGNYLLDKFNKEDNIKARELFEAAIKLDPGHLSAIVWLGATHTVDAAYGWSESSVDSFKRAHELAQKALSLDDKSANVHILLGTIYLAQRLHDKAITAGNRSISLAPNLSIAHAHLAATMFFSGRFEEAIALTEKAMRLSPCYPAFYLSPLARSHAFRGRYEEAIATSNQLYDRGRIGDYPEEWALIHLAGLYVAVGRKDEARDLVAEALKINPSLSLEFFKQTQPFKNPAHMQRELAALKKAGLK